MLWFLFPFDLKSVVVEALLSGDLNIKHSFWSNAVHFADVVLWKGNNLSGVTPTPNSLCPLSVNIPFLDPFVFPSARCASLAQNVSLFCSSQVEVRALGVDKTDGRALFVITCRKQRTNAVEKSTKSRFSNIFCLCRCFKTVAMLCIFCLSRSLLSCYICYRVLVSLDVGFVHVQPMALSVDAVLFVLFYCFVTHPFQCRTLWRWQQ